LLSLSDRAARAYAVYGALAPSVMFLIFRQIASINSQGSIIHPKTVEMASNSGEATGSHWTPRQ
jgi:hypothetical protein